MNQAPPARILAVLAVLAALAAPAGAQSTFPLLPDGAGVGLPTSGGWVRLTMSGRAIAFESESDPLDAWHSDIFVADLHTGTLTLASVTYQGTRSIGYPRTPCASDDGTRIVFSSDASDLVADDDNLGRDIFLRDLRAGTTTRIPVDPPIDPDHAFDSYLAEAPTISADGSTVVFTATPAFAFYPWGIGTAAVYAHDIATATTTLVCVSTNGTLADDDSYSPTVSADGRFVSFWSEANNLLDDRASDGGVFLRDRLLGTTSCISIATDGTPRLGKYPQISPDGRYVAFASAETDLVAFDHPVDWIGYHVFLHDRDTGMTELVTCKPDGDPANERDDPFSAPWAVPSGDGRLVAFTSTSRELIEGDPIHRASGQVFVRDRDRNLTRLVSRDADGNEASGNCGGPSISADGNLIAFSSFATNLFAPLFSYTIVGHSMQIDQAAAWSSYGTGWPGKHGVPGFGCSADPIVGTTLTAHVDSSSRAPYNVGFLLLGVQAAQIPTSLGGELLLLPIANVPFVLFTAGYDFIEELPYDESVVGLALFAQVLQFDSAASGGVSFTPGLELHVGF
ncbi:MAG: PD40 domain-containing protein [Planctomycetes bacterium]|nr:PD40 domain-containing protein [Planctomycetota bacterium]